MGLAQRPRTVSMTATAEKKWKALIHNDDIMASLTTNFLKPADVTETRDSAGNTITINYGDNNAVATWTQISRWLNTLNYPHWTLSEAAIASASEESRRATPESNNEYVRRHRTIITEATSGLLSLLHSNVQLNGALTNLDLTHMRQQAHNRVDTWLQGLHQACIRAHTKMILDKQRRDHTKKDNSGKLLAAIRDLQLVLRTPDGEAWDNSVDLQQRLRTRLTACEDLGPGIDTFPIGDPKPKWLLWEANYPGKQGEGLTNLLTRLAAQKGITALNGGVLPQARNSFLKHSTDKQLKSMNTKASGGKCQGLMIGKDQDTGLPIPTTQHDDLVKHIQKNLQDLASEKGSGSAAYPSTSALHRIIYNTTVDRHGSKVLRAKVETDMLDCLQQVLSDLDQLHDSLVIGDPITAMTVAWQNNASAPENLLKKLHFCPEPLELNAILIKTANRMEQEAMNTCFSNMVDQHTQVKNEILDTALSVAVNNHNNQTREPQLPDWDPQPSPRNTQDHPLPILTHADKVLSNWQQNTVTEIQAIRHCINTHARRLWYFANSRPTPIPKRDAEFRNILRPLIDVNDLKKELKKAKKGTTGRLTTVDELLALPDELLDAIRIICNMILSGECTSLLKCGDVAPLPKDIYRIRPITLLDPIFKIVDSILNARMMQVLQDNGLIADNVFGFIQGGAPEWAADLACTTQWHARRTGKSSFQVFLDATSAYDTISHSGVSAACSFAGVPRDVETTILAHLGGHNRIINTAYRLGDNRTTFSLGGGLAQGAPSSPLWYLFTSAPALLYTDNILKGYNLGQQESGTHILWSIVKSMDKPGRIFQNSSLAKAIEECNFMPRSAILDLQACSGSGTQYITYGNTIFQSSTVNADRSEILETDDRIKAENYADDNAINNGDMAETRDEVLRLLENTEQATDALTVSLSLVGVQTNLAKSFVTCSPRAHRLLKEPPTIRVSGIDRHGRLINNTLTPGQLPARNVFRYWGSPQACYRIPCCE